MLKMLKAKQICKKYNGYFNTMAVLGTKFLNKLPNVIKTEKIKIIPKTGANKS